MIDMKILITAVIGGVIGALLNSLIKSLIEEPLKIWVAARSQRKKDRQKKKILQHFRDNSYVCQFKDLPELAKEIFPKKDFEDVYNLFKKLRDEGLLMEHDFTKPNIFYP